MSREKLYNLFIFKEKKLYPENTGMVFKMILLEQLTKISLWLSPSSSPSPIKEEGTLTRHCEERSDVAIS
jgi:hypothetical protein